MKFFHNVLDICLTIKITIPRIASIALQKQPWLFLGMITAGIIHSLFWVMVIIVKQSFFDSLQLAIEKSTQVINLYVMLSGLAVCILLQQVINAVHNYLSNKWIEKMKVYMNLTVIQKIDRMNPLEFEDPVKLVNIQRARIGAQQSVVFFYFIINSVSFFIPYYLFLGIYLYQQQASLLALLLVIFLPVFICHIIRSNIFTALADAQTKETRKYEYYRGCITKPASFKEIRVMGLYRFFIQKYTNSWINVKSMVWKTNVRSGMLEIFFKIVTTFGYVAVIYTILVSLFQGQISIGFFAAMFTSLDTMYDMMDDFMTSTIKPLASRVGTINHYLLFMQCNEYERFKNANDIESININNVSFRYPHAQQNALTDISLRLQCKSLVAVVGANGSGKTTLMKIITGIYDPTEGYVEYKNNAGNTLHNPDVRTETSSVFQNFQRYQMTLERNVHISDVLSRAPWEPALQAVDMDTKMPCFPNFGDTLLSRELGGVDLSQGQWQRIAISRGVYRMRNIITLDEPTASIDALEESSLYHKFKQIAEGKISVLITHRIGSARIADVIIVLDKGRIIESGTHDDLMKKQGHYFNMVTAQAVWYQE